MSRVNRESGGAAVVIRLNPGLESALDELRKTGLYGDTLDDVAATLVREAVRHERMIGNVCLEGD